MSIQSPFVLCFGAQKAGTSWLAHNLRQHPETRLPPRKELRYFDSVHLPGKRDLRTQRFPELQNALARLIQAGGDRFEAAIPDLAWQARYTLVADADYNDDWYHSLFQEAGARLTGDFSPSYCLLPRPGIRHVKDCVPQAKLVFLLRNPVERSWSGAAYALRHRLAGGEELKPERFRRAANSPLQEQFSDYTGIIGRWESVFPRERILYLFHDDIKSDPLAVLRQVCAFLDLDFDEKHFARPQKVVNEGPKVAPSPQVIAELSAKYLPMIETLAARFGGPTLKWLEKARGTQLRRSA